MEYFYDVTEISDRYWKEIKKSAVKRGIEFLITPIDAWNVFLKQEGKCAYTGQLLEFVAYGYRGTASLDRIDSQKPYEIGNIQWVAGHINNMKGEKTDRLFRELCCQIADFSRTKSVN